MMRPRSPVALDKTPPFKDIRLMARKNQYHASRKPHRRPGPTNSLLVRAPEPAERAAPQKVPPGRAKALADKAKQAPVSSRQGPRTGPKSAPAPGPDD